MEDNNSKASLPAPATPAARSSSSSYSNNGDSSPLTDEQKRKMRASSLPAPTTPAARSSSSSSYSHNENSPPFTDEQKRRMRALLDKNEKPAFLDKLEKASELARMVEQWIGMSVNELQALLSRPDTKTTHLATIQRIINVKRLDDLKHIWMTKSIPELLHWSNISIHRKAIQEIIGDKLGVMGDSEFAFLGPFLERMPRNDLQAVVNYSREIPSERRAAIQAIIEPQRAMERGRV
ncbi:MAG: hypothetical protein Q9221_004363 [Calogaya cf. arnoldii]